METLNTILSRKDLRLLESAVVKYGKIVSSSQLKELSNGECSDEELRNRIALLARKGWLFRLKKGLYVVITDICTLGVNDISEYVVAQALNRASYVSFENALQYHGMFDQMLRTVNSATHARSRTYTVKTDKTYRFLHVRKDLYFGFSEVLIDKSYRVYMAEAEKALLDMLYFRSNTLTASVVFEKLKDYQHDIDLKKLKRYAQAYSLTLVREVGFLFDKLGIETDDLYAQANVRANSYSKMSKEADAFNAKWRLYYDAKLT